MILQRFQTISICENFLLTLSVRERVTGSERVNTIFLSFSHLMLPYQYVWAIISRIYAPIILSGTNRRKLEMRFQLLVCLFCHANYNL